MSSDDKEVSEELDLRIIDQESLEREAKKLDKADELVKRKKDIEKVLDKKFRNIEDQELEKRLTAIGTPDQSPPGKKKEKPDDKKKSEEQIAEAKLEKLEEDIERIDPIVSEISGLIQNPLGFLLGKIARGPILFKLLSAMLGLKVAFDIILGMIEDMFKPGGIADIRVRVLNEVKTISELDQLVDIRAGRIFFLADTRLTQSARGRGSTSELSNEMNRFRELNIGGSLFTN